jgi:opacity protein-like surface antigen
VPGLQAQQTPAEDQVEVSRPRWTDGRGHHITLLLSGGELEGPRQTETTDLELFTGVGLALSGGYHSGRFRFEGELHVHHSERGFTGDTVDLRTLMLNAYVDLPVSKRFAFFVGAGFGPSTIDVNITTCIDLEGCPTLSIVDQSTSAIAYQYMVGFGFSPNPRHQYFVAYRKVESGDLELRDSLGAPFAEDQLDVPMALIGITWRFPKSTD